MLVHEGLTHQIIGAAIQVHSSLGPGFLESVYPIELAKRGIDFERQVEIAVLYDGQEDARHRWDMLVADLVVVELKAIKQLQDVHFVVVRSYLRAARREHGLLLNFSSDKLVPKRVLARCGFRNPGFLGSS